MFELGLRSASPRSARVLLGIKTVFSNRPRIATQASVCGLLLRPIRESHFVGLHTSSNLFSTSTPDPSRLHRTAFRRNTPVRPQAERTVDAIKQDVADRALRAEQERELGDHWRGEKIQAPSIFRGLLFFLGFSALSFGGAAYYSLKDTEHVAAQLRGSRDFFAHISSFFGPRTAGDDAYNTDVWGAGVTQERLLIAKKHEIAERLGHRMEWVIGWCKQIGLPDGVTEFIGRSYIMTAEAYLDLPMSKQVLVPVVAINTLVFVAWFLSPARGRMTQFLTRNFMHRPSSNREYTMLTSVFSHMGPVHFLFNNIALWSFGGAALVYASHFHHAQPLIPEASQTPHFLSFFATAGVFAATVSHIAAAIRFRRAVALRGLEYAKITVGRQRSLGASGAVYAAVVMSSLAFPDSRISPIFLPSLAVPIQQGVAGLVLLDALGVIFRWRVFDHFAHLGGALFGFIYYHYGSQFWESVKKELLERCQIGVRYQ